jgi:phage terminase large subunit-like protein
VANLSWQLLPWQIECWQDKSRFKIIAAGRRCGKSNLAIKLLLAKALEAPEGSAVLYCAPTLGQARQICWDALLEQGQGLIKSAHVNNMDIVLTTGRKIHVRSGENKDALRGLKLYFAVIDEAAFVPEEVFTKIIRPALADLKGEAVIISTPEGRNHFYDWFKLGKSGSNPEWKSWHLTTADNPTIPKEEIDEAKKTLSSHVFKQEFEANFSNAGQEIFKEEWLKTGPEPTYGEYVIAIDLAGFEEVGKDPSASKARLDESAIAIVKVTDTGDWWVKDILHGRWDIRATASKILLAVRDHQPIAVGIERGALKNAVLPYLNDLMRKNNVYTHIVDLTHGNRRKQDRIAWSLQGRLEHGRITFNEDKEWNEAFDQISMFPTAGLHDDLVDALSYVDQLAITTYQQDYDQDDHEVLDIISGY